MGQDIQSIQREFERRRIRHRQVPSIGQILSEVITRRGLGRVRSQEQIEEAWQNAVGDPGSRYTRIGSVRRGVLEILVQNSVLLQELAGFQKQTLLDKLRKTGFEQIRELRFRLDD